MQVAGSHQNIRTNCADDVNHDLDHQVVRDSRLSSTAPSLRGRVIFAASIGVLLSVSCQTAHAQQRQRLIQKPQPKITEIWKVIYMADKRIGYSRQTIDIVPDSRPPVIRTVEETHMKIKRFGQKLDMEVRETTRETEDGKLLAFEIDLRNPPAKPLHSTGEVRNNEIVTVTKVGGHTQNQSKSWADTLYSAHWQDRSLKENPLRPGEKRNLNVYIPQLAKPTRVKIKADQLRKTRLLNGRSQRLLKVHMTQDALPGQRIIAWLDEHGETLKTEMPFMGSQMVTYRVDQAEALKAIGEVELDLAVNTLVRLKKPMNKGHRSSRAVFRLTTKDPNVLKALPADGPTQTTRHLSSLIAEVTVVKAKPPVGNRELTVPKEFLKPTTFLQSRDTRVAEHAGKAAGGELNAWRAATAMEKYVYRNLRRKNFSTALASAAEVAETMSGDCTEHAVLLAAMLRNRRIPSRIAVGLVYVESQLGFGGHMWTEAMVDGKWIPLDATLGRSGIGAAHIKLADSSFADDGPSPVTIFLPLFNLLGNVEIEVVSAE